MKITVIQYLLFLPLSYFSSCKRQRRHSSPLPAAPGHGSSTAAVQAVPHGQSQSCATAWARGGLHSIWQSERGPVHGLIAPRERGDGVGTSWTPRGCLLRRRPFRYFAGDGHLRRVDLGLSPGWSLATCRDSAARTPLSGPSALACTTVAHHQGFISGYLIFDCRQNETARTGRLACTAHKSENQAGLSAHVALPGKGLHALLAVVLHVRA